MKQCTCIHRDGICYFVNVKLRFNLQYGSLENVQLVMQMLELVMQKFLMLMDYVLLLQAGSP